MWFGVLGPVRVRVGERELPVGSRRERVVLAVLLLAAGRAVGGQRLIEAVWGPDAPPTAKAQLHNLVSALRRRVGGDVVRTRPSGYELRLDGHVSDVDEFRWMAQRAREAVVDGDHASAVSAVERALALWRGRAPADVGGEWAGFARGGLEDERLAAVELWLRGLLALGREDEALDAYQEVYRRLWPTWGWSPAPRWWRCSGGSSTARGRGGRWPTG